MGGKQRGSEGERASPPSASTAAAAAATFTGIPPPAPAAASPAAAAAAAPSCLPSPTCGPATATAALSLPAVGGRGREGIREEGRGACVGKRGPEGRVSMSREDWKRRRRGKRRKRMRIGEENKV